MALDVVGGVHARPQFLDPRLLNSQIPAKFARFNKRLPSITRIDAAFICLYHLFVASCFAILGAPTGINLLVILLQHLNRLVMRMLLLV